jgi:hypothetical protein
MSPNSKLKFARLQTMRRVNFLKLKMRPPMSTQLLLLPLLPPPLPPLPLLPPPLPPLPPLLLA